MRRFRLRRLEKVNIEALLITSGQNVKRLLAFGGRSPKKLAQAAALRRHPLQTNETSDAREHRAERSWPPTRAFFNKLAFVYETLAYSSLERLRLLASLSTTATCRSWAHHHHESRSTLYALGARVLFTFLDTGFREDYPSRHLGE